VIGGAGILSTGSTGPGCSLQGCSLVYGADRRYPHDMEDAMENCTFCRTEVGTLECLVSAFAGDMRPAKACLCEDCKDSIKANGPAFVTVIQ